MFGASSLVKSIMAKKREVKFNGKVVLITGGSKGLGLIMARDIGKEGGKIVICARKQDELNLARKHLIHEGVAEISTHVCDVSNQEQVNRMIDDVKNKYGTIDILINNASSIQIGPFPNMTIHDFEQSLDVIFWGTLYPIMAVLPHMKERDHGQIVNITSIGGLIGLPHLTPYSSSKFASVGLSRGLHAELKRYGITVSTIVPGLMKTGSHINSLVKGKKEYEYSWFALSSQLPLLSMNPEKAAKKIIQAIRRRTSFYVVGMPAKLANFANNNFPSQFANYLSLVNEILPGPTDELADQRAASTGKSIEKKKRFLSIKALSRIGRDSTARYQT